MDHRVNLLSKLPLDLLNLWSLLDHLTIDCGSDVPLTQKKQLTLDLLLLHLIGANIDFCGKVACRFCLRQIKASHQSVEIVAISDYAKLWLIHVANDGASDHTKISNTRALPQIVIPSAKAVHEALGIKGAHAAHKPPSTFPVRSGIHPRQEGREWGGSLPPRLERSPAQYSTVETSVRDGLSRTPGGVSQEEEHIFNDSYYNPFSSSTQGTDFSQASDQKHSQAQPVLPSWLTASLSIQVTSNPPATNPAVFLASPPGLSVKRQREPDSF